MIRYPWSNGEAVYLPIPKCATTSMRGWCVQGGWEKITTGTPDLPAFAFIRHPVDRWFSGVSEYAVHNTVEPGRMVYDQHTRPQIEYLRDYLQRPGR